jgi:predicted RNA-binding Zn-ribbon protein involved in translation (DUF1610 family)
MALYGEKCYISIKAPEEYPGKKYNGLYCYEHQYIWWLNTGEILKENENIHHKNGNKKDNHFSNLEKVTKREHNQRHFKTGITYVEMKCPLCGDNFIRSKNQTHLVIKNRMATLCSRSCSAKWSNLSQQERILKIEDNEIIREYKER